MITRIATLSLLLGVAAAAAAPRTIRDQRRLAEYSSSEDWDTDNYFCDCPCDDSAKYGSALVWMDETFDIVNVIEDSVYLQDQTPFYGTDENGRNYTGLCIKDMDVFDLLYGYGDEVFCDTECNEDESKDEDEDGYVDIGNSLYNETDVDNDGTVDYFDFSSDSDTDSDEDAGDSDVNEYGESLSLDEFDQAADGLSDSLDGELDESTWVDLDGNDSVDGTENGFLAFMMRETQVTTP